MLCSSSPEAAGCHLKTSIQGAFGKRQFLLRTLPAALTCIACAHVCDVALTAVCHCQSEAAPPPFVPFAARGLTLMLPAAFLQLTCQLRTPRLTIPPAATARTPAWSPATQEPPAAAATTATAQQQQALAVAATAFLEAYLASTCLEVTAGCRARSAQTTQLAMAGRPVLLSRLQLQWLLQQMHGRGVVQAAAATAAAATPPTAAAEQS